MTYEHGVWGAALLLMSAMTTASGQQNPITGLKPLSTQTVLVRNGEAQASIVMPTDTSGQQAARHLQEELRAKTGCTVPLIGDIEAWDTLWGKQNLIVVGNLMTNKVFAMLYCLHYACADGAWPGPDGYEVRTICDARALGQNILVLGGSDAAGVRAAVDAFLQRVQSGASLVLDHFIDTRIDGAPFEPLTDQEMAEQSGSAISRAVSHAVNYYRTGNLQYAELAKRAYLDFAQDMALIGTIGYTSGYDWIGIGWDLLEEAPVFTDEERLTIINGLVTFMEKSVNARAPIQDQPRPFHGVDMQTVHIYDTARYFEDNYPNLEVARKIMDRERLYWSVQNRYWTQLNQSSWYEGSDGGYMIQYAVQALDFEWLETGRFRKWLEYYFSACDNRGYMSGFGDSGWGSIHPYASWALQVGAWYYGEGWMQWMADRSQLPRRGGFNLGHSFYTGTVKPKPPVHLGDLYRTELADWMYEMRKPEFPQERAFNKISIQDGYEPGAAYLLLDGTGSYAHGHPATNQIVCFTKNGNYWLYPSGYMIFQIVEHNVMGVYRNGAGGDMPSLAELHHCVQVPGGKFVQSVVNGYNGADWSRSLLWRDGGTVVVIDRATAREPGSYGLQLVWRCNPYEVDHAARTVHTAPGERGAFHLLNADSSTLGVKDTAAFGTALYESTSVNLAADESYTYRNLFFVTEPDGERACAIAPLDEGAVVILEEEGVSVAGAGPLNANDGLSTDAALFWVSAERICLVNGTRFQAPGLQINAGAPVSLTLDLAQGELTVNPPKGEPATVTVTLNGKAASMKARPGPKARRRGRVDCARAAKQLDRTLETVWQRQAPEMQQLASGTAVTVPEAPLIAQWQITNDQFAALGKGESTAPVPGTNMVRTCDLDGDGTLEILAARTDKRLYCLSQDGAVHWTFEAPAQVWDVCADDVDGDGKLEVAFVCAPSATARSDSFLYLLDSKGSERWHTPCPGGYWNWRATGVSSPRGGAPGALLLCWIGDFSGDGQKEIGCAARNMFVYNYGPSGEERWEVMCPYHRPLSWRVADLNGDGVQECVVATDFTTVAYRGDGSNVPDAFLPATEAVVTRGSGAFSISRPGPALDIADLKSDGQTWIINGTRTGLVSATPYDHEATSGQPQWDFNTGATVDVVKVVEIGGEKRVLAGSRSMSVYCLDAGGQLLWHNCLGEMVRCIAAEDFNGDGQPEILVGCDDGRIYQLDTAGNVIGAISLHSPVRLLVPIAGPPECPLHLLASTWNGTLHALRWNTD